MNTHIVATVIMSVGLYLIVYDFISYCWEYYLSKYKIVKKYGSVIYTPKVLILNIFYIPWWVNIITGEHFVKERAEASIEQHKNIVLINKKKWLRKPEKDQVWYY